MPEPSSTYDPLPSQKLCVCGKSTAAAEKESVSSPFDDAPLASSADLLNMTISDRLLDSAAAALPAAERRRKFPVDCGHFRPPPLVCGVLALVPTNAAHRQRLSFLARYDRNFVLLLAEGAHPYLQA